MSSEEIVGSGSSSATTSAPYVPKRRNLHRGKACRNCRIRKSKCDGQRPSCSQCVRQKKNGAILECIYEPVPKSKKQTLEETIHRLETRIHQLEPPEPEGDTLILDATGLSLPSSSSSETDTTLNGDIIKSLVNLPYGPTYSLNSPSSSFDASVIGDTFQEEPPRETAMSLMQAFLPHAQSFGFFLNISRFCESASFSLPLGHYSRPHPGLLSTVYHIGFYLSNHPSKGSDMSCVYISRALLHVANLLCSSHPFRILHGIQAEVLLSMYFFRTGRIMEGKYHMNSAVSLAMCSGFHKLGSREATVGSLHMDDLAVSQPQVELVASLASSSSDSMSPIDVVYEGEKIDAFWMTFALANCWSVSMGSVSSMVFECNGSNVDTPWPLDDYTSLSDLLHVSFETHRGLGTVQYFLKQIPNLPTTRSPSALELYAKSSILLEQATSIASSYHPDLLSDEGLRFSRSFKWLDSFIDDWRNKQLSPLESISASSPEFMTLWATHTITNVATINLHSVFGTAKREKSLMAAQRCVELVQQVMVNKHSLRFVLGLGGDYDSDEQQLPVVNPFFGPLLTTVCQVLIEEIVRVRGVGAELPPTSSSSVWSVHNRSEGYSEELSTMLKEVFTAMEVFGMTCPLIRYQLSKLRDTYRTG
ncbi:hypothetical protein BT96DRAFT_315909 [Gymnopus androsaceus JB14]|uniref:Zn(2)-C6 fungal-type domain-containing protein n=1 Tax=Gymnopus androsaceus JB14 TaxID=1447944 RepID=A0A6A4I792_9AGAR|nr:hypothetical protein BT96DRAFT_315909 [Gymnopus androsaceus JB14]